MQNIQMQGDRNDNKINDFKIVIIVFFVIPACCKRESSVFKTLIKQDSGCPINTLGHDKTAIISIMTQSVHRNDNR